MNIRNIFVTLALMAIAGGAVAATGGGGGTGAGGLPWEAGLTSIVNSFTGPVAYAISVLGIVIAIGILIFGNDLNAFGRTIVFLVLAASVIVTAANTLAIFTGVAATSATYAAAMLGIYVASVSSISAMQELFLRVFRQKGNIEIEAAAAA